MPISDFKGKTFVAFLDLSGFKSMMKYENEAEKALNTLYNCGYDVLKNQKDKKVEGLFLSDCGILFVRDCKDMPICLESLLSIIQDINRKMLKHNYTTTTSIAYGGFKYQDRIEFEGIGKNQFCGKAYIDAFLDNEVGNPKIQPGQCRIIKKVLPPEINKIIEQSNDVFGFIHERKGDKKNYYFYWNVDSSDEIQQFERNYENTYNLKYAGMINALKSTINADNK